MRSVATYDALSAESIASVHLAFIFGLEFSDLKRLGLNWPVEMKSRLLLEDHHRQPSDRTLDYSTTTPIGASNCEAEVVCHDFLLFAKRICYAD